MRSGVAPLLLAMGVAACTTEATGTNPAPLVAPSLLDPPVQQALVPQQDEPVEAPGERAIREELARGADPEEAALQLASALAARERHHDALAAVEAALERRPTDGRLRVARAGLLRDLGMRAEAVRALVQLRDDVGTASLHPGILLELAELQWLEGEPVAAVTTLRDLQHAHDGHDLPAAQRAALEALLREVESEPRPRNVKVRDLLGNLRGAPDPGARLAALRLLASVGGEVAVRAVATGVVDRDAAVRELALQCAELDTEALLELAAAMLGDEAPRVRVVAAARLGATGLPAAAGPLLDALSTEEEEGAYTAVIGALARLYPGGPPPDPAGYGTAARRRDTAAAWSKHCNR